MSTLLYPPFLQWEITSDCNHKCIHCYNYWRANDLPMAQCVNYLEIADKIIERKPLYVAITGGEPLLVFPKVKECIDKFTNAGITVSISTNGTLITEKIAEYLEQKKVDLVISLPSINPQICDQVCQAQNVVAKLANVWPLLKAHHITTNINTVVNKINISTLYDTLAAVKKLGFVARVGMAQRPINASKDYLPYELDKNDFDYIVKTCVKAKKELGLELDFSVCMPDCAFSSSEDLSELEKGDCFGGTLAYAICTNGDIKACQCDTRVYGNILTDKFDKIYDKMYTWRDGSMIPKECRNCARLEICRGGCRVESYANTNDYSALPSFADVQHIPPIDSNDEEILTDYSNIQEFRVVDNVIFLKDKYCYRVSAGIVPTYLSDEFAEWLMMNRMFGFDDLKTAANMDAMNINLALDLLVKNGVIVPTKIK